MKGLLLKDFLVLKSYAKTLIVLLVFYGVFGVVTENPSMISSMIPFLSLFMAISAFSYDDSARWNEYALTLPVSRAQMVGARYVLALLLSVGGSLIALVLTLVISPLTGLTPPLETLAIIAAVSCTGLVLISVLFPVLYKFGAEKGRMILLLVVMLPFLLVFVVSKLGIPMPNIENPGLLLGIGLPVVTILALVVSYFISLGIMRRKEF